MIRIKRSDVQRAAPGMYSPEGEYARAYSPSNPLPYRLTPTADSLKERPGRLLVPDLNLSQIITKNQIFVKRKYFGELVLSPH